MSHVGPASWDLPAVAVAVEVVQEMPVDLVNQDQAEVQEVLVDLQDLDHLAVVMEAAVVRDNMVAMAVLQDLLDR